MSRLRFTTGVFKEEVDTATFVREAQLFLSYIRNGATDEEAVERAGATMADLAQWRGEAAFRHALRQAREGKGGVEVADTARIWREIQEEGGASEGEDVMWELIDEAYESEHDPY